MVNIVHNYYLFTIVARDAWMSGINRIAPARTTTDIDFAVLINDKNTYPDLKDYLVAHEGFHPYKGNPFVLIWNDGTEVDLLPFSNFDDEDGRVTISGGLCQY